MKIIRNNLQGLYNFLQDIFKNRSMMMRLSINDFRARYASSLLGATWAYVQPLSMILVLWFVFQVGIRSADIGGAPFIVWFGTAFLAWNYFSETLASTTSSLRDYSYLVRKVNFRVSIIPLVRIFSGAFVHVGLIFFIFVMAAVYKMPLSIYNLQVLYYFFCMVMLLIGLGWLLSAITPFVTDVQSVVSVIIQIGFWATPIAWNSEDISSKLVQVVLKINPMYYVIRGYRDAFVYHVWFWEHGYSNLYFWSIVAFAFALGAFTFKKLRPQFADVL